MLGGCKCMKRDEPKTLFQEIRLKIEIIVEL